MTATTDPFGNPLSLQHAASAAGVKGFIEGLMGYRPQVLDIIPAAADDASTIVQAYAAALQMFSETPDAPAAARTHLQRARKAALPATERERLFGQAVRHWVDGRTRAALALHEQLARDHPRDLASIKIGQYHAFNLGDSPALLRLALPARAAASDIAWTHGLLAFGHEQCHQLHEAEATARRGLAMRPAEPWAEHALAHVMLTDGRLADGAEFLQQASAGWQGLSSFMRSHNWWHLALFHIELGQDDRALALYDQQVWGVDKRYSQDQVGAVSLLARLELVGVDVGDRWQELAVHLVPRVADHVLPFLDLQYLYGLARAGRPAADRLMVNLRRHAAGAPLDVRTTWQRVALPAASGLIDHARGLIDPKHARWQRAAEALGQAMPQLIHIGGSHAQRDLFEQIYIDALQRAGQLGDALNLLQPKINAAPTSVRLRRRLRAVRAALGLAVD